MVQTISLEINDNTLYIKCIIDNNDELLIYANEYTQNNISQYSIGNFNNFCKICKEVFEFDQVDHLDQPDQTVYPHKITYDNYTKENSININITYNSIFEFNFCLTLSLIKSENKNVVEIKEIKKELNELKNVVSLMCNDIKALEKFVYSELNEIKIIENDNNEKLPIDCKNLTINLVDCLCCTVNKFLPYNINGSKILFYR
jgi:hypothetical protein